MLACAALLGCTRPAEPPADADPPPIVLITLAHLRADAVGALGGRRGVTPNLDRLVSESQLAVRGIASSASPGQALPAVIGAPARADGSAAVAVSLAERLRRVGYETMAFVSRRRTVAGGMLQGFESWQQLDERSALPVLGALGRRPIFVWIELPDPAPPYRRGARLRELLEPIVGAESLDSLPPRVGAGRLARAYEVQPSSRERQAWRMLYLFAVARADSRLGRLLDALRGSPAWPQLVVAAAGARGEVLGEYPPDEFSRLRRAAIEVPIVLRVPGTDASSWPCAGVARSGQLPATLLEIAGLLPAPAAEPSLRLGCPTPALSSYEDDGERLLSSVEPGANGSRQSIWQREIAEPPSGRREPAVAGYLWSEEGESPLEPGVARALMERGREAWSRSQPFPRLPPPSLPIGGEWPGSSPFSGGQSVPPALAAWRR